MADSLTVLLPKETRGLPDAWDGQRIRAGSPTSETVPVHHHVLVGQGMSLKSRLSSLSCQHGGWRSHSTFPQQTVSSNRMSQQMSVPRQMNNRVSPGRQTN